MNPAEMSAGKAGPSISPCTTLRTQVAGASRAERFFTRSFHQPGRSLRLCLKISFAP
jgi:hypothetical protein